MRGLRRLRLAADCRGSAALETVLVLPVMLAILGGMADFSLAFQARSVLASSVAQGAQYAFLAGEKASASAIQGVVQQALSLPPGSVAVSAPSSGCITGLPARITPATYNSACPDGTTAAKYVTISASYAYSPVLPFYSTVASSTLTEAATVRVQ